MLLLLSFASCVKKPWQFREMEGKCPRSCLAKLSYPAEDCFSGLELSFLKGDFGIKGMIDVFSRSIPTIDQEQHFSSVWICIDGESYYFTAYRMEGGQRLLLPDEATDLLLYHLEAKKSITIQLENYSATFCPANFPRLYSRFSANEA